MIRKPPALPDIEDATLRACLAPLMDATNAGGDMAGRTPLSDPISRPSRPRHLPSGSNDNPAPLPDAVHTLNRASSGTPRTLAAWRAQADDEFAAFRMIELFLAMTDAELLTAVTDFPRQIGGTIARLARIKRRLAAHYDTVTTVVALLERAMARAPVDPGDG